MRSHERVIKLASKEEYETAIAKVLAGKASPRDLELVQKAADTVGSLGSRARDALRNAGKYSR